MSWSIPVRHMVLTTPDEATNHSRQSLCARGCTEARDRICGEIKGLAARKDVTAIVSAFPCPPPQIEQKCCLANASSTWGQALNKKLKYAAAIAVLAAAIYLN